MGFDLFPRKIGGQSSDWTGSDPELGGGGKVPGLDPRKKVYRNRNPANRIFFHGNINYLKRQVVLTQGVEADKLEALRQNVHRLVRLRKITVYK